MPSVSVEKKVIGLKSHNDGTFILCMSASGTREEAGGMQQ